MKLRTKITAICILFFAGFSILLGSLILLQFREALLAGTIQREEKIYAGEIRNVNKSVQKPASNTYSQKVQKNIVVQAFRSNINGEYAVYEGNAELFNATRYDFVFGQLLDDESEFKVQEYADKGKQNLLIYTTFQYKNIDYNIIKVIDVTPEYQKIRKMMLEGLLMIFTAAAMGVMGLSYILKYCLQPLEQLKEAASHVADGNYDRRVVVKAKDEVGAIAVSFNRMASAVEDKIETLIRLNQSQVVMMGSIAHELRTPLTAMIGYASTLQRVELSRKQQEKALGYIESESRRLSGLSEKIMQLTSVMMKKDSASSKEPMTFPQNQSKCLEVVEEALDILVKSAEYFSIHIDPTMTMPGDKQLLVSLCRNIMENAVKASNQETLPSEHAPDHLMEKIEIIGERKLQVSILRMTDHGIGIRAEELPYIMEPFYMVDKSRSRKEGGAGLGLALCKAIADSAGIEFYLESKPGEGTSAVLRWKEEDMCYEG